MRFINRLVDSCPYPALVDADLEENGLDCKMATAAEIDTLERRIRYQTALFLSKILRSRKDLQT